MNHKRNEQSDECRITKIRISFFYNSHQTELCDREGKEGKDGGKNSIEEQMALCTLFFALAAFKGCREKRSNLLMERKKRNSGLDKMPKKRKKLGFLFR